MTEDEIPGLYETEGTPFEDKIIHLHYHIPRINFHWYLAEADFERGLAFGYAFLNDPQMAEWGYISLDELEYNEVGRDRYWSPKPFREIELD